MNVELTEKTLEARARRAAKRVGLMVRKSRRSISSDNWGGFMLIEPYRNLTVAGVRFDLNAEDVIAYCNQ